MKGMIFVALLLLAASCTAIQLGQPQLTPQFSTLQGIQIKAADIEVPLSFDADESEELLLLSEGFVCPGQSSSMSCQTSSTCICDYATLSCDDLPSCCKSVDANLWASACSDSAAPTSWLILQPGETLNVTAPPRRATTSPVYLRYHPSSDSLCSGFGLLVLAPFTEAGTVLSVAETVVYYVSWTSARPETDPNAAVLRARPGQSASMGRPRFCPSYDEDSAQTNGFFGAANDRTAFIAMYSQTSDNTYTNVASVITVELFETPSVSATATLDVGSELTAYAAVYDRETVVVPASQSVASFSYTHTGSGCTNVVVAAHANSAMATTTMNADYSASYVRWVQSGFSAASSILVNICLDQTLYFSVETDGATSSSSPGASLTLVTVYTNPTIALLNINQVNTNLFGPLLSDAKAVRMLCKTNNLEPLVWGSSESIYTTEDGLFVATCVSSYLGSNTPQCQIYPIANRENASLAWPAPPTGILGLTSYSQVLGPQLSSSIGNVLSPNLRFAAILQQVIIQSTYYGSVAGWVFRTWAELADCKLDFGGTLVSSTGSRIFGRSADLGQPNVAECDATSYKQTLDQLHAQAEVLSSPEFRSLPIATQRTALVHEMQVALTTDFSVCLYTPQEVYLSPYVNTVNCSNTDPCCPTADIYLRYFYDFCVSGEHKSVHPAVNFETIEAVGGDVACSTALSLETTTSQVFISTGANAISNIPCSFGQDNVDTLRKQLRSYYSNCRSNIAGSFDLGLPCETVDDCPDHPQMACLPVASTNLYNPSLSSPYRRAKMCKAPTAVFDELVLQCLLDTMPELCTETLQQTFQTYGLTGTFSENLEAFGASAGCAATGPSFLQTYTAVTQLRLSAANPAGQTYNSCYNTGTCPYPVQCIDAFCETSQGCMYPWGCATQWSSYTAATSEATCNSLYQCNFVAPGDTEPKQCTGDAAACQAECQALLGTGFCGHCDNVTGYCYVATDNTGNPLTQSECTLASGFETCLIPDLGSLRAAPCAGLGSCNHFADDSTSMDAVTAEQCSGAPGLCLTAEGSITFPRVAGCLGAVQVANGGCGGLDALLTDAGCLYSTAMFPNAQSCTGATDPLIPSRKVKGWVELVDTEEECTESETLFVCFLAFKKLTPLSGTANFNNRTVCQSRGGVYGSPYRWEKPTFSAGVNVALSWMSVAAVSAGEWTTRQNFPKVAAVINNLINSLQTGADIMSSDCVYSNILTVSGLADACQTTDDVDNNYDACRSIWQVTSADVRIQQLGVETVCDVAQINDDSLSYPYVFTVQPITLQFTNNTNLRAKSYSMMTYCVDLEGELRSNSKFLQPRKRIRETSFFIARQDVDIEPLATLSSGVVVNGLMITDAVRVSGDNMHIDEAWLCMQARPDFKDTIESMYPNRSDWTSFTLGMGVLNDWAVTPIRSTATGVRSTWLTPEGALLSDVVGRRVPEGLTPTSLVSICRQFDHFDIDSKSAQFFVGVLTFSDDPEDVPNGFSTAETVWLYITACVYISPVIFLWLPLVLRGLLAKGTIFSVPLIATFFLSLFLVFRSTLLFGLAAGTIVSSSTTEFALTDIAVWCEFAAVCLLGLVITVALAASGKLKTSKGFSSSRVQQLSFVFMVIFLLVVFVAFVIAYSQSGDTSSGITSPLTSCQGRVPEGTSMWTTRRILRLAYECLLAIMGLAIGLWLIWICWEIGSKTQQSSSGTQLFRLTGSTAMLAIMILSHAIIALILIGTEWNNFIFGITMLYVTELVPLFVFFVMSLWKNITEFSSLSFSWRTTGSGVNRRSTSKGGSGGSSGGHRTATTQSESQFP